MRSKGRKGCKIEEHVLTAHNKGNGLFYFIQERGKVVGTLSADRGGRTAAL
jgi:hypothetical protein